MGDRPFFHSRPKNKRVTECLHFKIIKLEKLKELLNGTDPSFWMQLKRHMEPQKNGSWFELNCLELLVTVAFMGKSNKFSFSQAKEKIDEEHRTYWRRNTQKVTRSND